MLFRSVATIPDEPLDRFAAKLMPTPVPLGTPSSQTKRIAFWPTAYLFDGDINDIEGRPDSMFSRNLVVINQALVAPVQPEPDDGSISLRGRDLKYASFDRSDLRRADMTGADLTGASMVQTGLIKVRFNKAKLRNVDFRNAVIYKSIAIRFSHPWH